jgi:zinc protease
MRAGLHKLPPFQRLRLANGLEAVLAEVPTVPLVHLSCAVPAGARHDPPGREGLSALAVPLLREGGTRRRTPEQIAAESEALGADLLGRVDWETTTLGIELLTADLGAGLDLLFDLLLAPSFPPGAVTGARQRQLSRLRRERWQPGDLADAELVRRLYGGTMFGRPLLGEEESLGRISPDDVARFHNRHFHLHSAVLVAAGSFPAGELIRRLEELELSSPSEDEDEGSPPARPALPETGRVYVLDLAGVPQTEIRLGYPAAARSHPDAELLDLLAWILGRRLRQALRDQRGLTYQARCRFAGSGPSLFRISAAVDTAGAGEAVSLLLEETERLRQETVRNRELAEALNHATGLLLRSFQAGHEIACHLLRLTLERRPEDHFERLLERLRRTTPDALREVAGRYLDPGRAILVLAGPGRELLPQLEAYDLSPEISTPDSFPRRPTQ